MRLPIRWKLTLATAVPLLVVYVLVFGFTFARLRERGIEELEARARQLATGFATQLDGRFRTVAQVARSTAEFLTIHPALSEEELYALLEANVRQNPLIYGSCLAFEPHAFDAQRRLVAPYVYRKGEALARLDVAAVAYDYTGESWEWFRYPRETGNALWTEPFLDDGAGDILMCTHSAPIYRGGAFRGVATIDIPLRELPGRIHVDPLQDEPFFILSRAGTFISAPEPRQIMSTTLQAYGGAAGRPDLRQLAQVMSDGGSGVLRAGGLTTAERTWYVYAPIESTGWSVAVMIPETRALAFADAQLARGVMALAAMLVIILACIWLVASRITRPLSRLSAAARGLGAGDLSAAVPAGGGDEVGDLAAAFNQMVKDIRSHVDALTRETAAREATEGELRVARQIQASLLPRRFPPYPDRGEFDLHAENHPAKGVAGDFFDFFFLPDDTLVMVMADVSGKGVPAAMFMAVGRTLLRQLASLRVPPAEVLGRANELLHADNVGSMFITVFLGFYEPASGRLRYVNGGHPPPLVLCNGAVKPFGEVTGPLLGVLPEAGYGEREARLEPGQALILYTDGVTDARHDDEMLGRARLAEIVRASSGGSASEICRAVVEEVDRFEGGRRQDDVTVLVLRRTK